ncbi:MAG TPA: flagellar basal body-associated protein FliL [Betaproteobacteria bacterium]|nr:flagellar basal body-associated protein FliL [Betaproteobacteria bacterium]
MAKGPQKAKEAESEEEAPAKKKGSKLLIIIIAVVILLGGGGAAWFFLMNKPSGAEPAAPKVEAPKPPIFMSLETFTVNLQGGSSYLQLNIDLRVSGDKVIDAIKLHMPEIRNGILLLLSSKSVTDLSTVAGKQKLGEEIRAQVNKLIALQDPKHGVLGVFFTSFVIQ